MDEKQQEALRKIWDSLTNEQREKAKACETIDELVALAGEEGAELPDELLDAVAGGKYFSEDDLKGKEYDPPKYPCPQCGSKNVKNYDPGAFYEMRVKCKDCGYWGERESLSLWQMIKRTL